MDLKSLTFELITAGIIMFTTVVIAWIFNRFFTRFIQRSSVLMRTDPTNYKFLRHLLTTGIYLVGFSVAVFRIQPLHHIATSLLAGAGILAVAVGFASQAALSNIISGIFLVVFKPFGVNDRITIKDTLRGVVEDITLRHTVIRDMENRRIIIPNSVISNEVLINADYRDERICRFIEIGISYDSDIDLAKRIMEEEALAHPLRIDARTPEQVEAGEKEVVVRVVALQDSAVLLRAWVWAANQADGFVMQCDLLESIKKRFDQEGVEIPFPHRSLVFKNSPAIA